MDIEKITNKARNSISKFCIEECDAYCCRKGHLAITIKEADLITDKKTKELENSEKLIKKDELSYALNLDGGCPSLKEFKCTIHKNKGRPKVCKEFPVFIEGEFIRFAEGCHAVRKGLLFPYEKRFLRLGFHIR